LIYRYLGGGERVVPAGMVASPASTSAWQLPQSKMHFDDLDARLG
jgi:hypothetical protein